MSELDGLNPREVEEYKRRYVDSHEEIKGQSILKGSKSGQYRKKNTIAMHPGDKNAGNVKNLKKPIEKECWAVQEEKNRGYIMDAFHLRSQEILDKKSFPIKDLVNAVIKLMPQRTEAKVEHDMTFADMVKSVHLEKKTYKAIDAED